MKDDIPDVLVVAKRTWKPHRVQYPDARRQNRHSGVSFGGQALGISGNALQIPTINRESKRHGKYGQKQIYRQGLIVGQVQLRSEEIRDDGPEYQAREANCGERLPKCTLWCHANIMLHREMLCR